MDQPNSTQSEQFEATSTEYLGQWNQLVSTTNWQKGRIIHEWREALGDSGAPAVEFSDEAWSRRVGNVSPQHVGRLRRVWHRFGDAREQYPGLYWSHFQAALDWDDAEMWLEGAVQSTWSVSQMREKRWETMGSVADAKPRDEEIVSAEMDDDAPAGDPAADAQTVVQDPHHESDLDSTDPSPSVASQRAAEIGPDVDAAGHTPDEQVAPFAELPELPDDLSEAFESFKLAILRHKTADWQDVAMEDVLRALSALRALTIAPSGA